MKGNPAVPGGSLKSKPTWLSTFGCLPASAFFLTWGEVATTTGDERYARIQFYHGAADRPSG
jgi:hypothetical protein